MTLTRVELARTVAEVVSSDDGLVDRFATELPAEQIAPVLVRAVEIRRLLQRLERSLETRYATEVGAREYRDEDGTEYRWEGTSRHEWTSVPDFLLEVLASGVTPAQLLPAISGLRATPLEEIGRTNPRVAHALVEFRQWRHGPPHLQRVDEGRKGRQP